MFHAPRPSLAFLVLALALVVALPATAAANADPVPGEVVADTFSVAELAASARQIGPGGRLFISGVSLEPGAPPEALELERFRLFAPDARIVAHGADGERDLPIPDDAFFRGRVAGDLDSLAVLSVGGDGRVRGLVQRAGRTWILGREGEDGTVRGESRSGAGAGPEALVAVDAAALPGGDEPFTCGQDDLPPRPDEALGGIDALGAASTTASLTTTPHTARVAVETDWELYQKFGNTDAAVAYVADLFAYSSSLYDEEIDTNLQVSYLSLWTTSADPWAQTSVTCGFFEFGRYWNANRTGVDRTLAHFLSGKSNGGGFAWLGVLCEGAFGWNIGTKCPGLPSSDNYGGDYGYSGDLDGFFSTTSASWDWVVVSHEIGHNFNSPHTHCYNGLGGSSEPVDECYNGAGPSGCYAGTARLPCDPRVAGCGTIMSYCQFQSGGLANIAPSFGTGHPHGTLPQRVPDRMRTHVEAVAASNPSCLARLGCFQLTMSHTGTGTAPTALPPNSPGCQAGFYDAGEVIRIDGAPAAGWRIGAWSGTDDDTSLFIQNAVTMPAANHAVNADYLEGCNGLALTNGTDNGTIVYDACDELTAGTTYRVGATGDVTLRSYQRVVLTDGFRVDSGGTLAVVVPSP